MYGFVPVKWPMFSKRLLENVFGTDEFPVEDELWSYVMCGTITCKVWKECKLNRIANECFWNCSTCVCRWRTTHNDGSCAICSKEDEMRDDCTRTHRIYSKFF
jgi:hypothetical protein